MRSMHSELSAFQTPNHLHQVLLQGGAVAGQHLLVQADDWLGRASFLPLFLPECIGGRYRWLKIFVLGEIAIIAEIFSYLLREYSFFPLAPLQIVFSICHFSNPILIIVQAKANRLDLNTNILIPLQPTLFRLFPNSIFETPSTVSRKAGGENGCGLGQLKNTQMLVWFGVGVSWEIVDSGEWIINTYCQYILRKCEDERAECWRKFVAQRQTRITSSRVTQRGKGK